MMRKIFHFIAKYFSFVAGFLFAFVLGLVYAIFRPQGIATNVIFIVLIAGFVLYLGKSFWELLDKEKEEDEINKTDVKIIDSSQESDKNPLK